ncbi:MAG TPA: M1 family aminopeptidase [Polyangiaceae bacterium]|nr:M1 family aminopeptidase [Polyangiaceae bacterium]
MAPPVLPVSRSLSSFAWAPRALAAAGARGLGALCVGLALVACSGEAPEVEEPAEVAEEELISFHGVSASDVDRSLPEVDTIGYDVTLAYRGEETRSVSGRSLRTPVFSATVTAAYVATAPITSLVVDFTQPHLGRVSSGSRTLAFEAVDRDHVRVSLGKTVRAGTGFRLTFAYDVLSREIDDREREDGGLVVTPTSMYSASWPRKGRWWLPLRDSPRDGAMFTAKLTFPEQYTVVSNGAERSVSTDAGMKTWRFELLTPTPTYGFFVGASTDWVRADATSAGGVPMPSWVTRAHASRRDDVLGGTPKALDFLVSTYGAFPFAQAGFVEVPTTWGGGGMEHPTVVAIDPSDFAGSAAEARHTAIHELCHHYSGNGVRIANWADFWLSEGFTEYLTHRSLEAVYGKTVSDARWRTTISEARATAAQHPLRPRNDALDVREIFDGVVYVKGAWVLRTLEEAVGREAFDAFLKGWFTRHKYKAVTTDMLQKELEAELHRSFDALFTSAVYGTGLPE